jgi:hypothetical protein
MDEYKPASARGEYGKVGLANYSKVRRHGENIQSYMVKIASTQPTSKKFSENGSD